MKRKGLFTLLLLGGMTTMVALLWAEELLSKDEAIAQAFPKPIAVEMKMAAVSSGQIERISKTLGVADVPRVLKYYEATTNGVIVGYALINRVQGKHGPITFLVAMDSAMAIDSVSILALKEQRGRLVRRRSFLSQFTGKKMPDKMRVHSDIRGITGATISSRAVASGVRRAVACMTVVLEGSKDGEDGEEK